MQCNMGAKNHGVVMSDANKSNTLNQLVGAAFGAAGQRCMALSTAVFVGEAQEWLPELKQRAMELKVNAGRFINNYFFSWSSGGAHYPHRGCVNHCMSLIGNR